MPTQPTFNYDIPALMQSLAAQQSQQPTMPGSVQSPNNFSLARYILLNANPNWETINKASNTNTDGGTPGPSVLSRVMDLLSRGDYASAEGARQLAMKATPGQSEASQIGDVLHGIVSGIAGTRKTTYSDVLREMEYNQAQSYQKKTPQEQALIHSAGAAEKNPAYWQIPNSPNDYKSLAPNVDDPGLSARNGIFGMLGDIFLDPTTYVGPGMVKSGLRGVGKVTGVDALKNIGRAKAIPEAQGVLSSSTNTANTGPVLNGNGIVNLGLNGIQPGNLNLGKAIPNVTTPGLPIASALPTNQSMPQAMQQFISGLPTTLKNVPTPVPPQPQLSQSWKDWLVKHPGGTVPPEAYLETPPAQSLPTDQKLWPPTPTEAPKIDPVTGRPMMSMTPTPRSPTTNPEDFLVSKFGMFTDAFNAHAVEAWKNGQQSLDDLLNGMKTGIPGKPSYFKSISNEDLQTYKQLLLAKYKGGPLPTTAANVSEAAPAPKYWAGNRTFSGGPEGLTEQAANVAPPVAKSGFQLPTQGLADAATKLGPIAGAVNPDVQAVIPKHITGVIQRMSLVGLSKNEVKQKILDFAAQFPYQLPEVKNLSSIGNRQTLIDKFGALQAKYGTEAAGFTRDLESKTQSLTPALQGKLRYYTDEFSRTGAKVTDKGYQQSLLKFAEKQGAGKDILSHLKDLAKPGPVTKGSVTAAQAASGAPVAQAFNLGKSAIGQAAKNIGEKAAATTMAQKYIDSVIKNSKAAFGKVGDYGPARQANFFQNKLLAGDKAAAPQLLNATGIRNAHAPKFQAARFASAYRMLKQAEEHMISQGYHPTFSDGSHLRLSEVIDKVGGPGAITKELYTVLMKVFKEGTPLNKIENPQIRNAIQSLQAGDAIKNAPLVDQAIKQTTQQASVADQIFSDARFKAWQDNAIKAYNASTKAAKAQQVAMSPQAQNATAKLLRQTFKNAQTPLQATVAAQGTKIQRYMTPGVKGAQWAKIGGAQTAAIANTLGTPSPAALGKIIGPGARAVEFLGAHFTTWYGQKELRPEALNFISSAINTANVRAKKWNAIAKKYDNQQLLDAFKAATGTKVPSDPAIGQLGTTLQRSLEDLFKASGLTDVANAASSVALRSGVTMADMNKQLKIARSEFRFTNSAKAVHPLTGDVTDFSKGTKWLESWTHANPTDTLDFMMKMETATEQLMHQYAFMDELAARFGTTMRSNVFSESVGHVAGRVSKNGKPLAGVNVTGIGRLAGVYFPKEIAPQIGKVFETWSQVYDPKSPLTKFFDRVVSSWKSGVTIYAPSHHIRNFTGDVYLSWLAGVNDPAIYNKARKVLFSERARYKDGLVPINNLISRNAINDAMTRPGDVVLRTKGGLALTAEQVYIAAHKMGLLTHAKALEDIVGDPILKWKPLGGRLQKAAQNASEVREHHVRLAHFMDAMSKSNEKSLPRLFADSAKIVRKWHPDGLDLTKFEREKMRRLLPFYSWTRKSVPLLVESALTRPGKVVAYNKGMYGLQQSLGINSNSPADPFPIDQLFPAWLKAKDIGPIFGSGSNSDYSIVNPSTPFNDMFSQFFGGTNPTLDPIHGVGQMLNPMAKVGAELSTGSSMLGVPVDYDLNRYLTEQIPIVANLSRLSNVGLGGTTVRGEKQGLVNVPGILNFLFAGGYTPTQQYIKQAEFEEKARLKKAGGG